MPHVIELPAQGNGLLVEVNIGISAPRRAQMWKQNIHIPPAVSATLIIDTGADSTMVNEQIMRTLGLTPTGQTRVMTSGSQGIPEPCDVYDIDLEILNPTAGRPSWRIQPLEVLARSLLNQATDGMLGRDVLSHGVLEYDGPRGMFRLTYH